jgi:hypothetical protein
MRKHYDGPDRYQFQRFYVKCWRQIRYRPGYWYRLAHHTAWWLLHGCRGESDPDDPMGRFETLRMYWDVERGMLDCHMGHTITMDELHSELGLDA